MSNQQQTETSNSNDEMSDNKKNTDEMNGQGKENDKITSNGSKHGKNDQDQPGPDNPRDNSTKIEPNQSNGAKHSDIKAVPPADMSENSVEKTGTDNKEGCGGGAPAAPATSKRNSALIPDHGTSFVPGAGPECQAPKALDHFKRGYRERAEMREKEYYSSRRQSDKLAAAAAAAQGANTASKGAADGGSGGSSSAAVRDDRRVGGVTRGRGSCSVAAWDDPWGYRCNDRPSIVQGMDVVQLVERLTACHDQEQLDQIMNESRKRYEDVYNSGKAMTAVISAAARRRNIRLAFSVWEWMDRACLEKNVYHYNSMISVTEKAKDYRRALEFLREMKEKDVAKNEVTFSSAISACEKCGEWRKAIELLDGMEAEGVPRTSIAYNACISACEKGMVPQKACEVFQRMKQEGIRPSVVSYSALISAAEKGGQWKLALEILEDMKRDGYRGNVVASSAAISALAKGQQWEKALELFHEIQNSGGQPSIVTYNSTMTALEKGMQWERALDLFDEMKNRNLPITVVSYGSAISACDKGLQYRQCLEYLDEMLDMGISKNVIIFGAAMSCMEKCCRADIAFQLMERMRLEGISPNVHIYNSAISSCARSNLWEKGYALFQEMDRVGVKKDVVSYNAVLDAVASQIRLGRMLFQEGVDKGFYSRVSRLGEHWFELDLHFLSLGGGEIALGWWFEQCLVAYLVNTSKLKNIKSISIVTGYGKTRTRGRRQGDDGMRKRCKAMLKFMNILELPQKNAGRIHIDKDALIEEVVKNGGKVVFDLDGYIHWKETETTANQVPQVPQKVRPRFKPAEPGSGRPPFVRFETESTSPEYRLENLPESVREQLSRRPSDAPSAGHQHSAPRRQSSRSHYDDRSDPRDSYYHRQSSRDSYREDDRRGRGWHGSDDRSDVDRYSHYGPRKGGSPDSESNGRRSRLGVAYDYDYDDDYHRRPGRRGSSFDDYDHHRDSAGIDRDADHFNRRSSDRNRGYPVQDRASVVSGKDEGGHRRASEKRGYDVAQRNSVSVRSEMGDEKRGYDVERAIATFKSESKDSISHASEKRGYEIQDRPIATGKSEENRGFQAHNEDRRSVVYRTVGDERGYKFDEHRAVQDLSRRPVEFNSTGRGYDVDNASSRRGSASSRGERERDGVREHGPHEYDRHRRRSEYDDDYDSRLSRRESEHRGRYRDGDRDGDRDRERNGYSDRGRSYEDYYGPDGNSDMRERDSDYFGKKRPSSYYPRSSDSPDRKDKLGNRSSDRGSSHHYGSRRSGSDYYSGGGGGSSYGHDRSGSYRRPQQSSAADYYGPDRSIEDRRPPSRSSVHFEPREEVREAFVAARGADSGRGYKTQSFVDNDKNPSKRPSDSAPWDDDRRSNEESDIHYSKKRGFAEYQRQQPNGRGYALEQAEPIQRKRRS